MVISVFTPLSPLNGGGGLAKVNSSETIDDSRIQGRLILNGTIDSLKKDFLQCTQEVIRQLAYEELRALFEVPSVVGRG